MFLHQLAYLNQNLISCWLFGAYASRAKIFSAGKWSMWIHIYCQQIDYFGTLSFSIVPRWRECHSRPRWHEHWSWLSASVGWRCTCTSHLQHVYRFGVVLFWQGRDPSGWFWECIAECLSITAFTFISPGNSTPHFFSSRTSVRGFLIRYCISSIAVRDNPAWAMLAILKTRRISHCSSHTRSPYFAIVTDVLKTYKKLVAASNIKIHLVQQLYTLP